MDRTGGQALAEQSSIPTSDEPPVVRRLRVVMGQLHDFTSQGGGKADKYARYSWLMKSVMDEMLDELGTTSGEQLAVWFEQFGQVIAWCGSGDDSQLPPQLRQYLSDNHKELLAITAGD